MKWFNVVWAIRFETFEQGRVLIYDLGPHHGAFQLFASHPDAFQLVHIVT
jgi:hypothetical protein